MHTRSRSTFTTIHSEGVLPPVDLLQRILDGDKDLDGLSSEHYHLPPGEKLNEAVNRAWNRLQGAWLAFRSARRQLAAGDPGTGMTRDRWLLPLFQELGYGRLPTSKAAEIEGKSYPISHQWDVTPIHLVGCGLDLDKRAVGVAGAARTSPHSLVQEYLNRREESTWGLVSNGLQLRVLRDNASLTRQAFTEFDLLSMFDGEVYSDFVVLWLICHQSRFEPVKIKDGGTETNWLEIWSKDARKRGTRALDQLRDGVEKAITELGSGFLRFPANAELRQKLASGELDRQEFYRQLLRLVYRLIFLFAAEDRDLLFHPGATPQAKETYSQYYSTSRLRRLAERRRGTRHIDLWQGLQIVFNLLSGTPLPGQGEGVGVRALGLPVLGGFLFSSESLPDLENCHLDNQSLLEAVRSLSFLVDKEIRRSVDYRNLGPEELGSIYESLLELHPQLNIDVARFSLSSAAGHERKTTGSYYTPTSLIEVLLDSALDPVIERAVQDAGPSSDNQQSSILNLKICDPACGSGHFLIAAAHRIARRLAQVQAGGDEPPPTAIRSALRSVIAHCIYGVDVNPMAVELCKVNLWLESLEPGKPLSFLDAHIQCGDSLVGVGPGLDISEITDEAFNPAFGDDKATATALKKRNRRERSGQLGFRWKVTKLTSAQDLARWRAERLGKVDAMPEDDPPQAQAKLQAYAEYQQTQEYIQNRLEYDLWTASFFWPITTGDAEHLLAPTQQELIILRSGNDLDATLVENVRQMAGRLSFFHWEFAFPQVYSGEAPGFDCVLGNPPWEMLQLDPREYFASKYPEVNQATNMAERDILIESIKKNDKSLYFEYENEKHDTDAVQKFIHFSNRFVLTSSHRISLMSLFAELTRTLLSPNGRLGIIVPTAIATDSFNQIFIRDVIQTGNLISLFDFENRKGLFPGVHRAYKFCLLVLTRSKVKEAMFVFYALDVIDIKDVLRRFSVKADELLTLNPNTSTLPVFRTRFDAELTLKIYSHIPILHCDSQENYWKFKSQLMFMMNTDSHIFRKQPQDDYVRLFEGKMVQLYNHRAASVITNVENLKRPGQPVDTILSDYLNPEYIVTPQYYVPEKEVLDRIPSYWIRKWLIVWKKVTSTTNERTLLTTIVPLCGISDSLYVAIPMQTDANLLAAIYANFSAIVLDYLVRQKLGGINLSLYHIEQLPVLPPNVYQPVDIAFIASRVLELTYTAYDLKLFAEDMGFHGAPFRWDEERRALLRAELDAYYARLYGLMRDELRYILDPKDVYGPEFPGETFRVLKEREIRQFGEYRTRRMILEAWDRLEGIEIGNPNVYLSQNDKTKLSEPVIATQNESKESKSAAVPKESFQQEIQPAMIDFSVYKCLQCDKMVMGFERDSHTSELHKDHPGAWKKIR